MIGRLIVLLAFGVVLGGCASLQVAKERVEDRAVEAAQWYCAQPKTARAILRVEANRALTGEARIVVGCAGDESGEYDSLQAHYVDPLGDASVNQLRLLLLERGSITLPDGTVLRVVIDE